MKTLKLIGLGIAIWSLTLVWPDISQTQLIVGAVGLALGWGLIELIDSFGEVGRHRPGNKHNGCGPDHSSRPVPLAS